MGPDFIIIGAMKCGTSTLAAQLGAQAGVFMTDPKEPNYFSDDTIFTRGPEWYADLFAAAPPEALKGEASTHYTKRPTYPLTVTRMRAAVPDLRLVYMIRNPVDRAVSHYIHEWSEGRVTGAPDDAALPEMVAYGRYAWQLGPYLEAFGVDRIHLTSLEQVKADPEGSFRAVADFLGLGPGAAWQPDLGAANPSAQRIRQFALRPLLVDNPVARFLRRTLVPQSVRDRVKDRFTMKERPDLPDSVRARMESVFLEDRARLAEIFPGHPALDLCYPFARP